MPQNAVGGVAVLRWRGTAWPMVPAPAWRSALRTVVLRALKGGSVTRRSPVLPHLVGGRFCNFDVRGVIFAIKWQHGPN